MDFVFNLLTTTDSRLIYAAAGLFALFILLSLLKKAFKLAMLLALIVFVNIYMANLREYTESINLKLNKTEVSFTKEGQNYVVDLKEFKAASVDSEGNLVILTKDGQTVALPIKDKKASMMAKILTKHYDKSKKFVEGILEEPFKSSGETTDNK